MVNRRPTPKNLGLEDANAEVAKDYVNGLFDKVLMSDHNEEDASSPPAVARNDDDVPEDGIENGGYLEVNNN